LAHGFEFLDYGPGCFAPVAVQYIMVLRDKGRLLIIWWPEGKRRETGRGQGPNNPFKDTLPHSDLTSSH
jgi:hypothetical protein